MNRDKNPCQRQTDVRNAHFVRGRSSVSKSTDQAEPSPELTCEEGAHVERSVDKTITAKLFTALAALSNSARLLVSFPVSGG